MNALDCALERWREHHRAYLDRVEAGGAPELEHALGERADEMFEDAWQLAAGGLHPSGPAARRWARAVRESRAARDSLEAGGPLDEGDLEATLEEAEALDDEADGLRHEVFEELPYDAFGPPDPEDAALMASVP